MYAYACIAQGTKNITLVQCRIIINYYAVKPNLSTAPMTLLIGFCVLLLIVFPYK